MRFRFFLLVLAGVFGGSTSAQGFVHINSVKPHLPVSPESPTVTFQWNGDSPTLSDKGEVFDGLYASLPDAELMEALLRSAMDKWNSVETSYLSLELVVNAGVVIESEDEIYAIVVETQDSKSVAATAMPTFVSEDKGEAPHKQSGRIIFDCDISISSAKVSAKSLLNTIIHELGHCVGLGHPHSNYHSIMSYASLGDHSELGLDDKAGISFLYPEPGESQQVEYMTSCGTIAGNGGGFPGVLLLIPLLFGLRRKEDWREFLVRKKNEVETDLMGN